MKVMQKTINTRKISGMSLCSKVKANQKYGI